jgi:putative nucleotidyltransferase-like protein
MKTPGGQRRKTTEARGALVAQVLAGSWRLDPPPLELDLPTLSEISPLLVKAGVGGLAWRRIKGTDLRTSRSALRLQHVHRYNTLHNMIHASSLKEALVLLRAHGIEPLLVKGWSLGSLYPEVGLRPFGDIDFCVREEEFPAASALLRDAGDVRALVDLHSGFEKFYEYRTEELFARSRFIKLDDLDVRVLCAEDHFRFLCLHLLRHGATRALWLCDIAAALEAHPAEFDWDLCLGNRRSQAEWVVGVVTLARELLAVKIEDVPVLRRTKALPRWFVSTVVAEWGTLFDFPDQVALRLRQPVALLKELPRHWPNPIEATMDLHGRLNELPRWPFQIGEVVAKTARLLIQTRGLWRTPR